MANVDFKLGEWFKQVDKSEKELKAKKTTGKRDSRERVEPRVEATGTIISPPASRAVERVSPLVVAAIEDAGDGSGIGQVREHSMARPLSSVATLSPDFELDTLEDDKIPQVEDFIMMDDAGGAVAERMTEEIVTGSDDFNQDIISIAEGTGTPRLLDHTPKIELVSKVVEPVVRERHKTEKTPKPAVSAESVEHDHVEAAWKRMPHHLQVLFGIASEEVAQRSYNAFKESRDEMIQRLVDPTLTLEETARLLNVCPTTVRRYTNRGVLRHHRTAGNQRRFQLSDVLGFIELQNGG